MNLNGLKNLIFKAQDIFEKIYDEKDCEEDYLSINLNEVTLRIPASGFGYDRSISFPVQYLFLSMDEIQAEIAKEEELYRLREIRRTQERKERDIKECKNLIKNSKNNEVYYKAKYKELTGEEYKEE